MGYLIQTLSAFTWNKLFKKKNRVIIVVFRYLFSQIWNLFGIFLRAYGEIYDIVENKRIDDFEPKKNNIREKKLFKKSIKNVKEK